MSYDQWKTASPYDDYDDKHCDICGMELDHDCDDDWIEDGFCSSVCRDGYEYWRELCAATDPGQGTPELWRPPVVRPMYELLKDALGGSDGSPNIPETWSRKLYKYTSCGAWLSVSDYNQIEIGSIVEGVEQCAEPVTLMWPFTTKDFWEAVDDIEEQCSLIWNETHGCERCSEHFDIDLSEYSPVWEDCPKCLGHGIPL